MAGSPSDLISRIWYGLISFMAIVIGLAMFAFLYNLLLYPDETAQFAIDDPLMSRIGPLLIALIAISYGIYWGRIALRSKKVIPVEIEQSETPIQHPTPTPREKLTMAGILQLILALMYFFGLIFLVSAAVYYSLVAVEFDVILQISGAKKSQYLWFMTIMSGILFWMLLVTGKNLGDGLMLCYMILGAAFIFLLYGHTLILIPIVIVCGVGMTISYINWRSK